jgi:hypothetical protein
MNCQEFWNTMPELGESDGGHLLECEACTARMMRQNVLQAGLRAVAAGSHRTVAPGRVETRLLTAFRQQSGLPAGRFPNRFAIRFASRVGVRWNPALAWTAAIAAMLFLGVLLVRNHQPQPVRMAVPHSIELASAELASAETQSEFDGFIPLPNSAGLTAESEEDVSLVRVALPRSAMLALGLDVSEDRAGELVEADIMLGSDGVARAVRFVDNESLLD